jgi:hypothetical protein
VVRRLRWLFAPDVLTDRAKTRAWMWMLVMAAAAGLSSAVVPIARFGFASVPPAVWALLAWNVAGGAIGLVLWMLQRRLPPE